ncbi:hypothetical protein Poly30_09790 [Planctomycetes bacterium Poly30]|uniref:CARDB domain-containing protein n=1 Tax=Saltatorellus ferox TaxID=2528018 RepID=A0A518EN30_9BACT|nr:hypothetical protein Poly30_09790 [Planctomycetes bacterium Poly30]
MLLALSLLLTPAPSPLLPVIQGTVDIVVQGVFLEPGDDQVSPGDNVTVEFSAYSTGGEQENVDIGYFLSSDAAFDSSDVLLDTDEIDVEPGDIEDESEQIPIPSGTASGCYYILVVADYPGFYPEPDELNNVGSASIAVDTTLSACSGNTANLKPANATINVGAVPAGLSVSTNVDLRNSGDSAAWNVEFAWYLSSNNTYDGPGAETLLAAIQIPSLPAGSEQALPRSLSIPAGTAPGTYFVYFVVDPSDTVTELNEGDNVRGRRLIVSDPAVSYYAFDAGGPNIGQITSIDTPTVGAPFEVSVRDIDSGGSGLVFASLTQVSAPRFGGTILADLATTEVFAPFALNQGRVTLDVDLPAGMSGSTLFFQAAARDFSQTQNVALTNGMKVVLP